MFPDKLSERFSGSAASGERRVFERLAEELDDSWYVFHDLAWNDPSLRGDQEIGQADFVIARPEHGFLVLEVKGGRCSYRAADRAWETRDRQGTIAVIKDPFDQAATGARVIWKLLLPILGSRMYVPRGQSAVLFPDCVMPKQRLRADVPPWRILDQEDLFNVKMSMNRLFAEAFPEGKLERPDGCRILDGIKQLWGAHDAQGRLRLDLRIKRSFEKLVALTERQQEVLKGLREAPRVIVHGCAGSGKTLLAIHKAKMLADEGKRVGLFCFNIPLAEYLQSGCQGYEHITVGPIAELSQQWLGEIGVPLRKADTAAWWDETLPGLVFDNVESIPHRFDAIVVDEGQDIRENYWTVMEALLEDPVGAVFYIFADQGQNIYRGRMNLSFDTLRYHLNRNIRNTNQVFEAIGKCCDTAGDIEPSGVDGPRPELYEYADDADMLLRLAVVVERLVNEAVSPNDIAILGTRSQSRTVLKYGEKVGPFRLVETPEKGTDIVTMTINRFKGLEAPVIILCEFDDEVYERDRLTFGWRDLLYVGMTRSTGHLIVLATGEVCQYLQKSGFRTMDPD